MARAADKADRIRTEALRQDAERRKLEDIGAREAVRIGRSLSIAVMHAYRSAESISRAVQTTLGAFSTLLTDSMTAAHLTGRLRGMLAMAAALKRQSPGRGFAKTPYAEAQKFLQTRLALSDNQIGAVSSMYGSTAVDVTRKLGIEIELAARKAMAETVAEGMHVRESVIHLRTALEKKGVTGAKSYLLETLVRTQTQLGYGAGRWRVNQDRAIQEILWGHAYATVGDDRVRPNHFLLEGTKLPKEHPRWQEIWPPNGFSCRCTTVEIFKNDRAEAVMVEPPAFGMFEGKRVAIVPDKDFAFNPGMVFPDALPIH